MELIEKGSRCGHDLDKLSRVCRLETLEVGLNPHVWIYQKYLHRSHPACTGPFPGIEDTSTLARTSFANRMPLVEPRYWRSPATLIER
jgi:hypothetical protein